MNLLRVGIAGANAERGWAHDAHRLAIPSVPGLSLHAVSARTPETAAAAARRFGAARAFDDTLAMIRDPEIDIVAVTVRVPDHFATVAAALQAGKPVYCEWPLGRTLDETRALAAMARASGLHVAIGLQGANAPAVRQAARLVAAGRIGRPLHLRVVTNTAGWDAEAPPFYLYLQDRENGATLASITGGHTLAAIEAVVGPYCEVMAQADILTDRVRVRGSEASVPRTAADHLAVLGRHAGGCVSTLQVIGGDSRNRLVFVLQGSEGTLTIRSTKAGSYQLGALSVSLGEAELPDDPSDFPSDLPDQPRNVASLWQRLVSDVRSGRRTVPDFDRAVALHALLERIEQSAAEGRRLPVGP